MADSRLRFLCYLLFSSLLVALTPQVAVSTEPAKKVLLIGIDGTRFDAIERASTPHLDGLMAEGIHSPACQILGERYKKNDTISGPGWSSILTGVWADKHGVHDNKFQESKYEAFPHFFARLKQTRPDARTASFVTWEPIKTQITSSADVSQCFEDATKKEVLDYDRYDNQAADAAIKELTQGNPDATFFYIGQVDVAGHTHGFHPTVPEYVAAIERADKLVGRVLAAMKGRANCADENWLVIVTSDHGGQGTGHGGGHAIPEILNSFLIVSGRAAKRGKFEQTVYLVDAPVTALAHLGVAAKDEWKLDGRPVGLRD